LRAAIVPAALNFQHSTFKGLCAALVEHGTWDVCRQQASLIHCHRIRFSVAETAE
jgi:hypothetical protein